jgi:hypothetical protein
VNSHKEAMIALQKLGDGQQSGGLPVKYRLPGRVPPGATTNHSVIWQSSSENVPMRLKVADCNTEKTIVTSVISELRVKLALDLDSSPAFERGLVLQVKTKTTIDYLIVGSSNATHLARALENMGYSTWLVSKPNWRINGTNAEQLAKMIKMAINAHEPGTVLLQFLDNSVYYAKAPDGSWLPPTADANGHHHMPGEIRLASKDTQLDHFRALSPVFDVLEQRKTLIVTLLPRYIRSSCCTDSNHGTNRAGPDFKKKRMADLDLMKRNLKDFIFKEGNRSMKLFDPNVDLRGLEEATSGEATWCT